MQTYHVYQCAVCIAPGEIIAHQYEVPIESIKWVKIPFILEDTNEVNAFHQGNQLHFKVQAEQLAKQQKLKAFQELTLERALKKRRLKKKEASRKFYGYC